MLCVLMVECMSVVVNVMFPCRVQPNNAHGGEVL